LDKKRLIPERGGFVKIFLHGLTIYIFPNSGQGTGIGTFSGMSRLGCQRVIEPDLSPLLYKSKPFEGY